ncbi:aminoacyl-tRNA hydrolase [Gemmatimonadota bacterium]
MDSRIAIVGLGNPGRDYASTRHNLGYRVIDLLCERWGASLSGGKGEYHVAVTQFTGIPVLLARPTTWMNQSGFAVQGLLSWYRIEVEDLLVVSDDVNLPVGRMRFRQGGASGGHRGLEHIIYQLGKDEFVRLRIGVGAENMPDDLKGYVLSPFRAEELSTIEEMVERSADAVETYLTSDLEEAMNLFN